MSKCYAISGGNSGIGAALANVLRSMGDQVISIDLEGADICADLSTGDGCAFAISQLTVLAASGLDGIVTCAGVGPHFKPVSDIGALNYYGTTALLEGVRPLLAMRKGAVAVVSSNSAVLSGDDAAFNTFVDSFLQHPRDVMREAVADMEGQAVYAGSKLALLRWVRHQAPEWIQEGVRVNAVAPGITATPLTEAAFNNPVYGPRMESFQNMVPAGGSASPEQIAGPIAFLLSYAASYVVGSVLFVDGGMDAKLRPKAS